MAQSRRVQLTTLSCNEDPPSAPVQQAPASKPPPGAQDEESRRADTGTVRLVLTLFEPDERRFPEFSYSHLIEDKISCRKEEVPLSRFEVEEKKENDELAAIAKKLEDKYGCKPKKQKDRIQDLIDIGYGYDDEDSFIDNSEAYDEFVPASITTKFGGFYINSGVLQFRQTSDTEDLTTGGTTPESSKKRKLNGGKDKPKKKVCREDGEMKKNMDQTSRTVSENGQGDEMKKKKKKKAAGTLSVTSMLKKFQREKEKERQKMEEAHQRAAGIMGVPTMPLCPADAAGGGGLVLTDPLLSLIGSTNDHALIQAASTMDFDLDLDSLLEVSEDSSSSKTAPQPPTDELLLQPEPDDHTQPNAAQGEDQPSDTKTNQQLKAPPAEQTQPLSQSVALPEGLPASLEDSIQKLMVFAKTSGGESKLKFFTPEINSVLLDIELQCRELGGPLRSKVYTHLSSFLPCSRDTLLKRVKKLHVAHTEEQSNLESFNKLSEAISKVMPEQIQRFQKNCEQVKTAKATEEEKDGKQKVIIGPEDNVEEKSGKKGGPRKLFKWNEEIRECFSHVLKAKMEGYKKEKNGGQEVEEYLKTLLDSELKPLWPKGWMQSRVLLRESRKILGLPSSVPVKRVRPEKKQQLSSCGSGVQGYAALPQAEEDVFIVSPNSSAAASGEKRKVPALKTVEIKTEVVVGGCRSTAAESGGLPVITTSASTSSLLGLLADQALAQQQPLCVSHELLAAAVAKFNSSNRHWSFNFDTKSPPLPPPPPHTTPVAVPEKLKLGDLIRSVDPGETLVISDDSDAVVE